MAAWAVVSIAISAWFLLRPGDGGMRWSHALPMWVYCLLSIAIPVYAVRRDRVERGLLDGTRTGASPGGMSCATPTQQAATAPTRHRHGLDA